MKKFVILLVIIAIIMGIGLTVLYNCSDSPYKNVAKYCEMNGNTIVEYVGIEDDFYNGEAYYIYTCIDANGNLMGCSTLVSYVDRLANEA